MSSNFIDNVTKCCKKNNLLSVLGAIGVGYIGGSALVKNYSDLGAPVISITKTSEEVEVEIEQKLPKTITLWDLIFISGAYLIGHYAFFTVGSSIIIMSRTVVSLLRLIYSYYKDPKFSSGGILGLKKIIKTTVDGKIENAKTEEEKKEIRDSAKKIDEWLDGKQDIDEKTDNKIPNTIFLDNQGGSQINSFGFISREQPRLPEPINKGEVIEQKKSETLFKEIKNEIVRNAANTLQLLNTSNIFREGQNAIYYRALTYKTILELNKELRRLAVPEDLPENLNQLSLDDLNVILKRMFIKMMDILNQFNPSLGLEFVDVKNLLSKTIFLSDNSQDIYHIESIPSLHELFDQIISRDIQEFQDIPSLFVWLNRIAELEDKIDREKYASFSKEQRKKYDDLVKIMREAFIKKDGVWILTITPQKILSILTKMTVIYYYENI